VTVHRSKSKVKESTIHIEKEVRELRHKNTMLNIRMDEKDRVIQQLNQYVECRNEMIEYLEGLLRESGIHFSYEFTTQLDESYYTSTPRVTTHENHEKSTHKSFLEVAHRGSPRHAEDGHLKFKELHESEFEAKYIAMRSMWNE
jgi:hypothetical protein